MNHLDRAYALVPSANCKGLCQESCGPVIPSNEETARILARHSATVDFLPDNLRCTLLDAAGRCTIYTDRPLLCRLFASVEGMPCPHGCLPTGGYMRKRDERKAWELIYGKKGDDQ